MDDWDELSAALLELIGQRVAIDVYLTPSPAAIAGIEGILVNATTEIEEGRSEEQVTLVLRVQSEGSTDTSYVHIFRPTFREAKWMEIGGERTLTIDYRPWLATVVPGKQQDS